MATLENLAGIFINPIPYHLISISTLVGAQIFQSVIVTKIAFNSLPRPAFHSLQKRLFPAYFQLQFFLIATTIATSPGGPLSLIQTKSTWIPCLVAGVTSVLNLVVYGPRTRTLMIERVQQSTRDKSDTVSPGETSLEMQALNKQFSRNHAMSIHLNYMTLGASLFYTWAFALRLKL